MLRKYQVESEKELTFNTHHVRQTSFGVSFSILVFFFSLFFLSFFLNSFSSFLPFFPLQQIQQESARLTQRLSELEKV